MTKRDMLLISVLLVAGSAVLFGLQLSIFHDPRNTAFYLLQDLAFLPLTILVVTVIVSSTLADREKQLQQHKMNMVIGAFFSDVGRPLLTRLCRLVEDDEALRQGLALVPEWTESEMRAAIGFVRALALRITPEPDELLQVRDLLREHREFMLRLLENPTLLEHEAFTDVLWAVFHLEEELTARVSLHDSPASDLAHLAGDTRRALLGLLVQWLEYMIHLSRDYPFLFSFAARMNPLREDAKAEVT